MSNSGSKNRRKQTRIPTRNGNSLLSPNPSSLLHHRNSEFQRTIDDPIAENQMMFRSEKEQTKSDLFWGIDKDNENRRKERIQLEEEDIRSSQLENYHKNLSIYKTWDTILQQQQYQSHLQRMTEKQSDRDNHLRFIKTPTIPSEQLVSSIWSNNDNNNAVISTTIAAPQSLDSISSSSYLQSLSNNSSSLGTSSADSSSLHLHIDGMLQSKAIVKEASLSFSQTLKRLYHTSHPITESLRSEHIHHQQQQQHRDNLLLAQASLEMSSSSLEEEESRYVEDIDGHPDFKWDQHRLLRQSFSLLDSRGRGVLTFQEMNLLSSLSTVHSLLRFTVMWSLLKRREWSVFIDLLDDCGGVVKEDDWLKFAEQLSIEEKVPLRRIRSNEEHQSLSMSMKKKKTTDDGFVDQREFLLKRQLHEGDVVWGLHRNGVRWLPAVVLKIRLEEKEGEGYERGEGMYDLRYPLTQKDLERVKVVSSSRQLLRLPSAISALLRYPQPFEDELKSSGFAFDLVDNERIGMVPLKKLISSFRSKEFKLLLESNLSLSIIFGTTTTTTTEKRNKCDFQSIPSLLPVFLDTFSSVVVVVESEEEEKFEQQQQEEEDWISKSDFLEFCKAVVDIKRYSVVVV